MKSVEYFQAVNRARRGMAIDREYRQGVTVPPYTYDGKGVRTRRFFGANVFGLSSGPPREPVDVRGLYNIKIQ